MSSIQVSDGGKQTVGIDTVILREEACSNDREAQPEMKLQWLEKQWGQLKRHILCRQHDLQIFC